FLVTFFRGQSTPVFPRQFETTSSRNRARNLALQILRGPPRQIERRRAMGLLTLLCFWGALMPDTIVPPAVEAAAKVDSATYTVGDIAALLQASERHVWRLHDAGKMPSCIRLGRLVRWPKQLIDDWIDNGCPAQPNNGHR